jgi:hypothetical protein
MTTTKAFWVSSMTEPSYFQQQVTTLALEARANAIIVVHAPRRHGTTSVLLALADTQGIVAASVPGYERIRVRNSGAIVIAGTPSLASIGPRDNYVKQQRLRGTNVTCVRHNGKTTVNVG